MIHSTLGFAWIILEINLIMQQCEHNNLDVIFSDDTLRSEYRSRVLVAIGCADGYGEDFFSAVDRRDNCPVGGVAHDALMNGLIDLEMWLKGVFGASDDTRRIDPVLEDRVVSSWSSGSEDCSIEEILDRAGRSYARVVREWVSGATVQDDVILRPEEVDPPLKQKLNEGSDSLKFQDRVVKLIMTLHERGFHAADLNVFKGIVEKKIRRKLSYVVVEIPKLNKEVLVNDQVGEGTFVIDGIVDRAILVKGKKELESAFGKRIRRIVYRSEEQWINDVMRCLFESMECLFMDSEYFTEVNVRRDLQKWSTVAGLSGIEELSTSKLGVSFRCVNGDKITGATYLNRAGVNMGLFGKAEEASDNSAMILRTLKRKCGIEVEDKKQYPPMDEGYFTRENVERDLASLAAVLELSGIEELSSADRMGQCRFKCANEEMVSGRTYLNRAGIALGLVASSREAHGNSAVIFETLKEMVGIETKKYKPMDEKYFTNENVKADLQKFMVAMGLDDISGVTINMMLRSDRICCTNGEMLGGSGYISRAGIALGVVKDNKEAQSARSRILNKLKVMANS